MILIVPNPEDVGEVEDKLKSILDTLNLNLNEGKTQKFDSSEMFHDSTDIEVNDPILDDDQYNAIIDSLWLMNKDYRQYFSEKFDESNALWWSTLEDYRNCLTELGIFITLSDLSRRLYRILFNSRRFNEIQKKSEELYLPSLPIGGTIHAYQMWRQEFVPPNNEWVNKLNELRDYYSQLLQSSWQLLQNPHNLSKIEEKQRQKWLRFASNRLVFLGLNGVIDSLVEILCTEPWRIRDPIYIVEHMARQGHTNAVKRILHHFEENNSPISEYLRAVCLRSLRFIPMQIDFDWEPIASYAVQGSIVERLMSTETWLFLDPSKPPIQDHHLHAIWHETKDNRLLPDRLIRNYLMILARYVDKNESLESLIKEVVSPDSTDYTLLSVTNSIHAGNRITLFDYEEPAKIRRKYYGTRKEYDEDAPERDT